jgi:hypothetical protein
MSFGARWSFCGVISNLEKLKEYGVVICFGNIERKEVLSLFWSNTGRY